MSSQIRLPFALDATGSVATINTEAAVDRQNLIALIGTAPGERCMRPTYGVPMRDLLFDLDDAILAQRLEDGIKTAVRTYAPEITLTSLIFDTVGDEGRLQIALEYDVALDRLSTGGGAVVTSAGVGGI